MKGEYKKVEDINRGGSEGDIGDVITAAFCESVK